MRVFALYCDRSADLPTSHPSPGFSSAIFTAGEFFPSTPWLPIGEFMVTPVTNSRIFLAWLFVAFTAASLLVPACKHATEPGPSGVDTTSHNFVWRSWVFGDGSYATSVLNDVAIINDTMAYAVGEVYFKDSTGQIDNLPYNLVRWNGTQWEVRKIPYYYQGQALYYEIGAIFARRSDDIWLGIGNLIHWDGQRYETVDFPSGVWGAFLVSKFWGDESHLYAIGGGGSIASYDGRTWRALNSGTSLHIQDIWGTRNPLTGTLEVIALASTHDFPANKALLRIDGTTVTQLPDSGLTQILSGVWFAPGGKYYIVGDGMFQKDQLTSADPWQYFSRELTPYYTQSIRGSAANDVLVCGDFGTLLHYNGSTWHNYQSELNLQQYTLHAVAIKGNMAIAVGTDGVNAIIVMGRR